jgi:hypothetical protein
MKTPLALGAVLLAAACGTVDGSSATDSGDDPAPAVAGSWPPRCGARGTPWSLVSVTGHWEGATFAVRGVTPAAVHDPDARHCWSAGSSVRLIELMQYRSPVGVP